MFRQSFFFSFERKYLPYLDKSPITVFIKKNFMPQNLEKNQTISLENIRMQIEEI